MAERSLMGLLDQNTFVQDECSAPVAVPCGGVVRTSAGAQHNQPYYEENRSRLFVGSVLDGCQFRAAATGRLEYPGFATQRDEAC